MSERQRVEALLAALEELRCIDSTLNIDVSQETFDAFEARAMFVEDLEDDEHFWAKLILQTPGPRESYGSGVTVALWSPLQVDAVPSRGSATAKH